MVQAIKVFFLAFVCLVFHLQGELYWHSPKEMPGLSGYVDHYQAAMNKHGKVITCFDDAIFGSYDVGSNHWDFYQLNFQGDNASVDLISGYKLSSFSSDVSSRSTSVILNDNGEGMAIFKIASGPNLGKIGALRYRNNVWGQFFVLSEEAGMVPTIGRTSYGRAVAVWINQRKDSKYHNCLMGAFFDEEKWVVQGAISDLKSVEMSYHQSAPQIQVNEIGDAVALWKSRQEDKAAPGKIIACVFDGVEDKWLAATTIGEQPLDKKGLSFSMNNQGDAMAVWDVKDGIESAYFNVCHHIIKQTNISSDLDFSWISYSDWKGLSVAQGSDLGFPKVLMQEGGEALVVWLRGYEGVNYAYFSLEKGDWITQGSVYDKVAYALSLQKAAGGGIYTLFIAEGDALDEMVCSRIFNSSKREWGGIHVVASAQNSLVDTVEIFSIASEKCGIVMWYDFFRERLFYSLLKEEKEIIASPVVTTTTTEKKSRKENILYEKKQKLAQKRAQRKK